MNCFNSRYKFLINWILALFMFQGQYILAQNSNIVPNYLETYYPVMRFISNGEEILEETVFQISKTKDDSVELALAKTYHYRVVIGTGEIWDWVIIEKIGLLDDEGIFRTVINGIQVPLYDMFPFLEYGEGLYFKEVNWITSYEVELIVSYRWVPVGLPDWDVTKPIPSSHEKWEKKENIPININIKSLFEKYAGSNYED